MKRTIQIFLVAAMVLMLGACTRNHGDIGIWFGTWRVEQITVGGMPDPVDGDYFFQFQSKVFRVSRVYGHEQLVESYGTWEESEDGRLTVTFPDNSVFYIEMPGLEVRNEFVVQKSSGRQLVLTKVLADGSSCIYLLKKQP